MLGMQYRIVDHMVQSKHRAKVVLPSFLPSLWGCYASVGPLLWILTTCSRPFGTILGSISFLTFANSRGIVNRTYELKSDSRCLIKSEEVFLSICLCLLKLNTVTNKSRTRLKEWVWGDREIGGKPNYQIKERRSAWFQNSVGDIRLLWKGQAG